MIPLGRVTTYSSLAKILGTHPRVVGIMLSKNKNLIKVPCHRVIKSNGRIGGYVLGAQFKRKLLELEGVKFCKDGRVCKEYVIDISSFLLGFKSGNFSEHLNGERYYGDDIISVNLD